MTHYIVLVIGEDVEGQLAPYDENIEMPEYKRELVSKEDKRRFTETYIEFKKSKNYGVKSKEKANENSKLSFEELYKKYGDDWNGNCWKKHTNGEWWEYSTYNPKSKWDWFEIGGRWAGSLKLNKNVSKSEYGHPNFSYGWDEKDKKEVLRNGCVDSAFKKDIDFSPDKKIYKESIRFWELKVEGQEPKNDEDKEFLKRDVWKKEYYLEKFKTKEIFAKLQSEFTTYAILKDGEWLEAGQMGWFGCSSATPKEQRDFKENFYDKFIKDLPDDTLLTIVDCHI